MKDKKVELVLATATKINASDSLIVVVDPQFADYADGIQDALEAITGHPRHAILPLPQGSVKFYRVQNDLIIEQAAMEMPVDLSGDKKNG